MSSWGTSVFQGFLDKLPIFLINILDGHILLMEHDVSCDIGSLNSYNVPDVFQNDQPKRHILPKEPCIEVKLNLNIFFFHVFDILAFNWKHGELDSGVALVGVEYSF